MLLDFRLPLINPHMTAARIECLFASPGSALKPGDKLLDISVDLSSSFSQDCPPISYFRVIVRENVFLRELCMIRGQPCKVGETIAFFSTIADEARDVASQRGIRVATAGIVHHSGLWTGNSH
jgi:hypothetical protein